MALKSLEELNRGFMSESLQKTEASVPANPPKREHRKKRGPLTVISIILLCLTISMALLSAFLPHGDETPKAVAGYYYFTVLTSSMQDELPKDSLILVKQAHPQSLKIGDNITYMRDGGVSVTHKIIDIYEDYRDGGARGFQTKGTNSAAPDKDIIDEANVVGKVVFSIPAIGAAMSYLRENIYTALIILLLLTGLLFFVRKKLPFRV